jgi:thiol-disulfide isomerase/thioredoxin
MKPPMRSRCTGLAFSICVVVAVAGCGRSQPSRPSPEAEQILLRASDFYKQQTRFRVSSRLELTLHDKYGAAIEGVEPVIDQRTIIVQNSGEFSVEGDKLRLTDDGTYLRLRPVPSAQRGSESFLYWRTEAPVNLRELSEVPVALMFGGPASLRSVCLFDPGLDALLRSDGEVVFYKEQTTIGGRPAHHLSIQLPVSESAPRPVDVTEVWIAAEGDPVLLQMLVSPAPRRRSFGRTQIEASAHALETFENWEFGGALPLEDVGPPSGGRRVAELSELLQPPSPLIGQSAPPTVLPLLDGTTISLDELKASGQIVILDFWATWCGPCRHELPFVVKLAEQFADQGVVLYAVNQQESPQLVQSFVEQQPFAMTVALDESGEISAYFNVRGLPCLYMIGRDGTVQVNHVGVGPETEQHLREELEALIAGRNIATDGLPDEPAGAE